MRILFFISSLLFSSTATYASIDDNTPSELIPLIMYYNSFTYEVDKINEQYHKRLLAVERNGSHDTFQTELLYRFFVTRYEVVRQKYLWNCFKKFDDEFFCLTVFTEPADSYFNPNGREPISDFCTKFGKICDQYYQRN